MLKTWSICATAFALAAVLAIGVGTQVAFAARPEVAPGPPQGESNAACSIPRTDLISPDEIIKTLQSSQGEKPLLVYVGFRIPYAEAHIPGSEYFGPAAKPDSLQELRKHLEGLPRKRFIVIYCGCCPWNHCPNVKPAYEALHELGFTKLKVIYIPDNFGTDWVDKGYPTQRGE